ncbi:MAG: tetratricopeptide repeat protein [Endomicrobiia bacterium]
MFIYLKIFSFVFEQQESGYVLETIFSFPQQTKYLGLGYVNNSLLNINSTSFTNPAVLYEVFYKEINFLYYPLVLGSNFFSTNFTTAIKTKDYYFPLSITVGNYTSGEAEKFNILKESYGYKFKESITYTNIALSYYLRNIDTNLGINFKTYYQTIDDYYAYCINFDLGVITPAKNEWYCWGISVLNILPVKFGSEILYPSIKTSLNHKVGRVFFSDVKIYTEFDLVNIHNIEKLTTRWGVGTTYDFFKFPLSLSFSLSYYSAGIGFDIEKENFNFSYALNYSLVGYQHRFALGYKFDFYPEEYKAVVSSERQKIDSYKTELLKEYKLKKEEIEKSKEEYKKEQQVLLKITIAKQYVEEKKYVQAKEVLQQALKISPENKQVKEMLYIVNTYLDKATISRLYIEAKDLYEKGSYDVAIDKLNKILELEPGNNKALILLKLCIAQKNIFSRNYKEAKLNLFEVLKLEPDNQQAIDLLKKVDTLIELEEK